MLANPKASKRPAFSALYHVRTQGISFDVPIDLVKILIRFDGKRFETALIDMTVAHHIVVLLPASYMRHGQTLHETPEVSVIFWPHHKMPVIGHQAITQNAHRTLFKRVRNDPFKRQVVLVVEKQLVFSHAPVKNVE